MTDDFDPHDEKLFNEALRSRDEGNRAKAISMLDELAKRRPKRAAVVGTLATLLYDAGQFAHAAANARKAIALSSKSELASLTLCHSLFAMRDVVGAFAEIARFRSTKQSDEYERILLEREANSLRDLQAKPDDPFLNELLSMIRAELKSRPVKQ
jgi:predicted Zn-dependent protease